MVVTENDLELSEIRLEGAKWCGHDKTIGISDSSRSALQEYSFIQELENTLNCYYLASNNYIA